MILVQNFFNYRTGLYGSQIDSIEGSLEQLVRLSGAESVRIMPVETDILPDRLKENARYKKGVIATLNEGADMQHFYSALEEWSAKNLNAFQEGSPTHFVHRTQVYDRVRRQILFNWKKDAPKGEVDDVVASLDGLREYGGVKSAQIVPLEAGLVPKYLEGTATPYSNILSAGFDTTGDALTFNNRQSHLDWGKRFKLLREDPTLVAPVSWVMYLC